MEMHHRLFQLQPQEVEESINIGTVPEEISTQLSMYGGHTHLTLTSIYCRSISHIIKKNLSTVKFREAIISF